MPEGVVGQIIRRDSNFNPNTLGVGIGGIAIDKIYFKYFDPITNDVAAEYDEVAVRGRSEPLPFYVATGEDTYSFNIKLVGSVDENDAGDPKNIWRDHLFIKSLQFPDYSNNRVVRPPAQAIITIGNFFRKRGIIKNPKFTWNKPYDSDGYPHSIDCEFTFRAFNQIARSYGDVLSAGPDRSF